MKQPQRRHVLRDIAGLLATAVASSPAQIFETLGSAAKPDGNATRSKRAQSNLERPRIAPPTQSVMRRA